MSTFLNNRVVFLRSESRPVLTLVLLVPGVRGLVLDRLADEGRRWARRDAECAPSSLPPSDVLQDVHHQRPSALPVDDQDVLHVPECTAFVKLKHISCALHASIVPYCMTYNAIEVIQAFQKNLPIQSASRNEIIVKLNYKIQTVWKLLLFIFGILEC